MPRVRKLSDDDWDEIKEQEAKRQAARDLRWALLDRWSTPPHLRAQAREVAEYHLRQYGLPATEEWRLDPRP